MTEETYIDKLNQAIRTGEQARILFEILLSTVGLDIDNPEDPGTLFKRLNEVQEDYTAAVNDLRLIIKERHTKQEGVSVSNY